MNCKYICKMSEQAIKFKHDSRTKATDLQHRKTINFNMGRYNAAVPKGKLQFADTELARKKAKNLKWRAIENLDRYLETFEANARRNGAKVLWAIDANEAIEQVLSICREKNCRTLVKSKSMVTEEIHLNHALQSAGIESVETDLGEYIQQLDNEPPYHIVTPAMHKSKEDVAALFHEKLGTPIDFTPAQLTLKAREILRDKFATAEVGVTGANFLIADCGGIAITENEGNARLSCAFPKTHIVIAGIEKVIPALEDLALFWPLLSTYGTGQKITSYSSVVTGPRNRNETDGPDEMYIILLDNGRTNIIENEVQRESLYCIRCGACLNACPVYKNIGGHAYAATYSGPIGSVITPNLAGLDDNKHLSYASSLCGNCTEVCSVKINLHHLLLDNRKQSVEQGMAPFAEKAAWKMWKMASLNRGMMNMGNGNLKTKMVSMMFKGWQQHKDTLRFSKKTFNQQWKERNG